MVLFLRLGQLFPTSFSNAVGPQPLDDALMSFVEKLMKKLIYLYRLGKRKSIIT